MSKDKSADASRNPADRLKAMQSKHAESVADAAPAPEASLASAPSPVSQGGGAGMMGAMQAAMAAGGGEGGRAAMMQKLRQALSGPDGQIDQQKARFALMFIRKQAADPAAPRHELAKKIEGMIRNMPPQQRQRLMAAAGMGGGMGGGFGGGFGGGGFAGAQDRAGAEGQGQAGQGAAWLDNFFGKG